MTKKFQFARRTNWPLGVNPLTTILDQFRAQETPIFDLTESNPTRCGFDYPLELILKPLADPDNLSYDPSPRGSLRAREAISQYYREKNLSVLPEQIFLTASTSEAYGYLFRLLVNQDERVLFPKPSYPLFQFFVDLNDIHLDYYLLKYGLEGWHIDFSSLQHLDFSNIKAIVLVNPNNPTGSFLRAQELEMLNQICQKHYISLISDEVFADFVLDQQPPLTSLVENQAALTFVLGGFSKTLALPQMKLSWIILQGPPGLVKEAMDRLEVIADTYLSVNAPVQNAAASWLAHKDMMQQPIKRRLKDNLEFLKKQTDFHAGCRLLKMQGGWYAVLKLPNFINEEAWAIELLKETRVFVHPGYFFDFDEAPYIVLSLLPPQDIFQHGISCILNKLKQDCLKA